MQRFDLNQDPFDYNELDELQDQIELIVTDYSYGYYEGSGIALVKTYDGRWFEWDLGHCSCYGPRDAIELDSPINIERFLQEDSSTVTYNEDRRAVQLKLKELVDEKGNLRGIVNSDASGV